MAFLMLNGVYQTGASSSISLASPVTQHTISVKYTDANDSISALTYALQATMDGADTADADATWVTIESYALIAAEITAKAAITQFLTMPLSRIRVNITTITGAASADAVYIRYEPLYQDVG